MKRVIIFQSILIILLICFTACNSNKNVQPVESLAFGSNGDGTCYVRGVGTCTDSDIIIPSTSPEGDTVTAIQTRAFQNCESITGVTIPNIPTF